MTATADASAADSTPESRESPPRLALYHFDSCPYCVMVRRAAEGLGVELELRNIQQERSYQQDLMQHVGRTTVPVLRIEQEGEVRYLPESMDIVAYLRKMTGQPETPAALGLFMRYSRPLTWALLLASFVTGAPFRFYLLVAAAVVMAAGWILRSRLAA